MARRSSTRAQLIGRTLCSHGLGLADLAHPGLDQRERRALRGAGGLVDPRRAGLPRSLAPGREAPPRDQQAGRTGSDGPGEARADLQGSSLRAHHLGTVKRWDSQVASPHRRLGTGSDMLLRHGQDCARRTPKTIRSARCAWSRHHWTLVARFCGIIGRKVTTVSLFVRGYDQEANRRIWVAEHRARWCRTWRRERRPLATVQREEKKIVVDALASAKRPDCSVVLNHW